MLKKKKLTQTVTFGATFFHNLTELNIRNSAFLSHEIRITWVIDEHIQAKNSSF